MGPGGSRNGRRLATLALGVALAAGAACGGSGDGTAAINAAVATEDSTTTTAAPGAAFAACLREHGVDPADRQRPTDGSAGPPSSRTPGTGNAGPPSSRPLGSRPSTTLPAGVDQAKVAAAREACQSLQPTDRAPANGPPSQAFQVYASCMKDHAVTVMPGAINRDDDAFKAADAICGVLRPAPPQL